MRFIEFADPKGIKTTAAEAEEVAQTASTSLARPVAQRSRTIRAAQQKAAVSRAKKTLRRAMNACRRLSCWVKSLPH